MLVSILTTAFCNNSEKCFHVTITFSRDNAYSIFVAAKIYYCCGRSASVSSDTLCIPHTIHPGKFYEQNVSETRLFAENEPYGIKYICVMRARSARTFYSSYLAHGRGKLDAGFAKATDYIQLLVLLIPKGCFRTYLFFRFLPHCAS